MTGVIKFKQKSKSTVGPGYSQTPTKTFADLTQPTIINQIWKLSQQRSLKDPQKPRTNSFITDSKTPLLQQQGQKTLEQHLKQINLDAPQSGRFEGQEIKIKNSKAIEVHSELDRLKVQSKAQKMRLEEYSRQAPAITATTWLSSTHRTSVNNPTQPPVPPVVQQI